MIQKLVCALGVLCFLCGCACMDSDCLTDPIILILGGGMLMLSAYKAYEL